MSEHHEHQEANKERTASAFDAGAAAAGCGLGCIREIIWIGILLVIGFFLLATCTPIA